MTSQNLKTWLLMGMAISIGCYFSSCSSQQQQKGDGVEASQDNSDYDENEDGNSADDNNYDNSGNYNNNAEGNSSLNGEYGANNNAGGYDDNTAEINNDLTNDTQDTDLLGTQGAAGGGNYGGDTTTATAGGNATNLNAGGNYAAAGNPGNFGAAVDPAPPAPVGSAVAAALPPGGTAPRPGGRVRYVPSGGVEVFSSPGGGQVVTTLQQGEHPLTFEENGFLKIAEGWYVPAGSLSDKGVGRNPAAGSGF